MAGDDIREKEICCSFCGRTQDSVDKLIAGNGAFICNECVKLCLNIIEEDYDEPAGADVSTICVGMAASMGAFLLAAGAKGKRIALPNAEIMIHQPSGGSQGQATDIQIQAQHILKIKQKLNGILAENTGKSLEQIAADCERDYFMSADEAKEYGLIDKVIYKR